MHLNQEARGKQQQAPAKEAAEIPKSDVTFASRKPVGKQTNHANPVNHANHGIAVKKQNSPSKGAAMDKLDKILEKRVEEREKEKERMKAKVKHHQDQDKHNASITSGKSARSIERNNKSIERAREHAAEDDQRNQEAKQKKQHEMESLKGVVLLQKRNEMENAARSVSRAKEKRAEIAKQAKKQKELLKEKQQNDMLIEKERIRKQKLLREIEKEEKRHQNAAKKIDKLPDNN